uniref:Uncharacterized protein n=1 Tax=Anguilla anguilla TaxID=7936 RepID=A0A0E9VBL8_ANGAN
MSHTVAGTLLFHKCQNVILSKAWISYFHSST